MRTRALITGITGQDGSYLAELLTARGYEVHGIVRHTSTTDAAVRRLFAGTDRRGRRPVLHGCDLCDASSLERVVHAVDPDEVYNLGAQSHVHVSFEVPTYTTDCVTLGTLRLLEAVRAQRDRTGRAVRFYQASSSEMFGVPDRAPQHEATPFRPRSPYGAAKAAAHWLTVNYREAHGLHASCGILFNHESPRRGESFVTRKTTRAVGRIYHGLQQELVLGSLEARRDWGWAPDYVEAMWRMLQQDAPDDYVVATGHAHSVQDFVVLAFRIAGLDWRDHVRSDPSGGRPASVEHRVGDATKAHCALGWSPRVGFEELVERMVAADLDLAARERVLEGAHPRPPRTSASPARAAVLNPRT